MFNISSLSFLTRFTPQKTKINPLNVLLLVLFVSFCKVFFNFTLYFLAPGGNTDLKIDYKLSQAKYIDDIVAGWQVETEIPREVPAAIPIIEHSLICDVAEQVMW